MNVKNIGLFAVIALFVAGLSGCATAARDVPPGYIGKILTPSNGWEPGFKEAGQVDLGQDMNGLGNRLVLCEASSVKIKEVFGKGDAKTPEDHRIITKSLVPLAVDLYIQVMAPDDPKMRDSIFAQMTPTSVPNTDRVSTITLQQIYDQFAMGLVRSKTRDIFARYKDYPEVMAHYGEVNNKIAAMVSDAFKETKVPLKLVAAQVSNVKADETLWAAENRNAAAKAEVAAIDAVGAALARNPRYVDKYKWDIIKDLAGKDVTIIVNDGASGGTSVALPHNKK